MSSIWIKNYKDVATTRGREKALKIVEAGLDAISTKKIIGENISIEGGKLKIKDKEFSLDEYKRLRVIGFGKASCDAAVELERILGNKIRGGVVIDIDSVKCEFIDTYSGDHPRPSVKNLDAAKCIVDLAGDSDKDDLVIVIVSGGGSALLCWPEKEYQQSTRLYDSFLSTGGTIKEINIVRRHLSLLKGGGLAKALYPANVVGIIFCDIAGGYFSDVASGPTYKDETTIDDAKNILEKYDMDSNFDLTETPKEDKFFKKVINIPMVSNREALLAMEVKAEELGFSVQTMSKEIYKDASSTIEKFFDDDKSNSAVFAGGEISVKVDRVGGKGGRNQHLVASSLDKIKDGDIFVSIASDGLDNSDAAGAIADMQTIEKIKELGIDEKDYIKDFNEYELFEKTGDLIFTGSTGSNVADLMLLLRE